jgi:type III pantothenate kinase
MLLALDVGNSNTVLGLYELTTETAPARMVADWRITTPYKQTADELGVLFQTLFAMRGIKPDVVTGVAVSSVVPPLDSTLRRVCESYFHTKPLFIEPGVKTGLPILTDNPSEVGADRVVNCVAAYDLVGGPAIVVDMGTATTFDVVSAKGEFLGGAIAPGLGISADALFARAARLTRVEIKKPAKLLERMIAELGPETKTIATGGLAKLIATDSKYIHRVEESLTLNGLRLIYERNHDRHKRR